MFNMHNTHARSISNGDKFVRDLFFTLGVCVFISASNTIHSYKQPHKRLAKIQYKHSVAAWHAMPCHGIHTLTNCIQFNSGVPKRNAYSTFA